MSTPRKLSVFLCHASQDKPVVRELYQRLKQEDWIDPWLDEEKLKPGQIWTSTIEDAIDSADSVIIFFSNNSVSKEGFIQRELKRAWERSTEKPENVIFLIPFRLEDCNVPHPLRTRQWGDYFGASKERTYQGLLVSLKERHEQRLQLETKERARAEELKRVQKETEGRIRREKMEADFNEAILRQREEQVRREKVEALLAQERARWEEEKKTLLKSSAANQQADVVNLPKEKTPDRSSYRQLDNFTTSTYSGSSILIENSIVHFEALGRGRPVIFLHGWVGSWRYWFRSMQVASQAFRSYALDLWGFGDTARRASYFYSIEQQSVLLEQFLNEMGIGRVALIGHGLGALVGMQYASRFPQNVDRIMAISCPLNINDIYTRLRNSPPQELADWLSSRTPEAITALSDAAKADPQAIAASFDGLQTNHPYMSFRDLNISCLFLYGDKDMAISVPYEFQTPLSYYHPPMIQPVFFEDSGHFPMVDEPLRFERLLMDFLRLQSGQSPSEIQLR